MKLLLGCRRGFKLPWIFWAQKKTPKGLLKFCETPVIQRGFQRGFQQLEFQLAPGVPRWW